jgi:hypothetical protein
VLQDEGFVCPSTSLGRSGYLYDWKSTHVLVLLLGISALLDRLQEARVFIRTGLHFKLSSVGSSTFNSTYSIQVSMDDIGRRCWKSIVSFMKT